MCMGIKIGRKGIIKLSSEERMFGRIKIIRKVRTGGLPKAVGTLSEKVI